MKPIHLIPVLALASVTASPAAIVLFSTGFESDTAGGNPGNFTSRSEPSGTNIAVSTAQASAGTQSLLMADNSTGTGGSNPNLVKDFGANHSSSILSFDYIRTAGASVSFRIDFFNTGGGGKNFDLLLGGTTQGSVQIRNSGGTTIANSGTLAAFNPDVWNTISLEMDETAGTANVFLNGNKIIDNYTNAGINWNLGRVQLNMGFSSATGIEGHIDELSFSSVPEPTSALLLSLGSLLAFRRRR